MNSGEIRTRLNRDSRERIALAEAVRTAMRRSYFVEWTDAELASELGRDALEEHVFGRFDICREQIMPWIARHRSLAGARVLEIGCGTGSSTAAFATECAYVEGYDIDHRSIEGAQQRLAMLGIANVSLHLLRPEEVMASIRGRHAASGPGAFDVALFYAVLEHQTPTERLESLRTCWELLSPGGLLVVGDTPNRLTWTDRHTSLLPFFDALPDPIAVRYARYSPREHLRRDMEGSLATNEALALDHLARWGRGVSYHEFELALGDLRELVVGDGFDPEILSVHPPSLDERLLYTYWLAKGIDKPLGFVRANLDLILRKPGGSQGSIAPRDLSRLISPLFTEQIGVRGAIRNYLAKLRRRYL